MLTNKFINKRYALMAVFCAGISGFILNQAAFAAEESQDAVELDEYVVTGSYIARPEMDSITPLVVIGREKIERSGATTINELLQKSIVNASGMMDEKFTQSLASGTAGINLRGLGMSRTLVLLDGRRMPLFPFAQSRLDRNDQSSFVDINLIPLSAVERIEILKDGASAMYGADAIAGVVNIITHKDYDGAKITGQYGATLKVDGEEGQAKILAGKTWENTNVTLAFDYFNRSEVKSKDRKISESSLGAIDNLSVFGSPAGIFDLSVGTPTADPRCSADKVTAAFGGEICRFDFAPFTTLIPEVERTNFMGSLEHDFNEQLSFFARGMYSNTSSERSFAPGTLGDLLIVAPNNPNNPSPGTPLGLLYRFTELGARVNETSTESFNFVGGLKGEIAEWDWELGAGIGYVETEDKGVSGYASKVGLQEAVNNGSLNPFGSSPLFNSATVALKPTRQGESKVYYVDFKTSGNLLDLPYGTLDMAVGTEYRREKFSDSFDKDTLSGDIISVGGISGSGGRQIEAAYFEFYATVLEQLEMQFAGRVDHYSDFGATFNPKFSLRWKPIDSLALRGNVGTGFKTPTLQELYTGESVLQENVYDPVRQEDADNIDLIIKGNPDLDPEESFSYGVGFAWDVTDWWQLSLDYWNIRNDNAVVSTPQYYVDNEAKFGFVTRADPNDPTSKIESLISPFGNVASQKMWGLDMSTSVSWDSLTLGYFRLDGSAAYLGSFREEVAPGTGFTQYAGRDGVPHWRANGSLTWTKSDYEISFTTNFVDGYTRRVEGQDNDYVGTWTTVDLQGVWSPGMLEGATFRVGSNNVFDTAPPEDPHFEKWPFFNGALASPRGRFLYLQAQYEF